MKLFGVDHRDVDRNNIEFVYVYFKPYQPTTENSEVRGQVWNPNLHGVFSWGAKGVGFGEVAVYGMGEKAFFTTETEPKSFIKQMLAYWVEQSFTDRDNTERPEHYLEYGELSE